ncbi:MAG: pentapeptide repeat-containing protein [Alloacidobacterium sp.]|jgi:uncharacterized protein YjbI with pentapeptide repeats
MANPEHLAKLMEGVEAWNQWRKESPDVDVDLLEANLNGVDLLRANLNRANLNETNLRGADLRGARLGGAFLMRADLTRADLRGAFLNEANLRGATLNGADLRGALLRGAYLNLAFLTEAILAETDLIEAALSGAYLLKADLSGASLWKADLRGADLSEADLKGADLSGADLSGANLLKADLSGADLSGASLIGTIFEKANLTDCNVYGVSVWDIRLEGAIQSNLVITQRGEPAIQVDNLEVAQFVYLLLNNERIRHVIDTITSKVVLILGRFTPERKAVLDAIRDEVRKRDYLPILFDFQKPDSKDLTGTVTTLANMARFIIADLTDPSCIPYELGRVVPNTKVPVQAIILDGKHEFAMFNDLLDYRWVLPPYRYQSEETLIAALSEKVIAPAEAKVIELRQKLSTE